MKVGSKTSLEDGYRPRRRPATRNQQLIFSIKFFSCLTIFALTCFFFTPSVRQSDPPSLLLFTRRHLMQSSTNEAEPVWQNDSRPADGFCNPRAVEEFPQDFMSLEQKRAGGIVLYIVLSCYLFVAISMVCESFFVASLERICEVTRLKADVAGATFMAAGSSAPELFTSTIGVFITKNDVGVSTIIGSAVFNILVIIGVCGLFAGCVIHLTWWPTLRDSVFYGLSIVALAVVLIDGRIVWYEASIFLGLYAAYILVMYFNEALEKKITRLIRLRRADYSEIQPLIVEQVESSFTTNLSNTGRQHSHAEFENLIGLDDKKKIVDDNEDLGLIEEGRIYVSPLKYPNGWLNKAVWWFSLPINLAFVFTIPDCRRKGFWSNLYILTFLISIVWIAVITYIIVWMISMIGDSVGIPDTVMSLTILAAGTSVADAMSSLFVARDGYGDMALSNGIGSNVFDILICLGVPWFLKTVLIQPGSHIIIYSGDAWINAIILFATVFLMILLIIVNRWQVNKKLGFAYIVLYIIIMGFVSWWQTVYGLPTCERTR